MKKTFAINELLKSVGEMRQIQSGKRKPSRVIHYDPAQVREIRKKLKVSQVRFASMIGISPATLRNWEQGRTYPEGAARALLRVAATRPDAIIESLA